MLMSEDYFAMHDDRILHNYAEALIDRAMQAFNLILPHYDESTQVKFSEERQSLIETAHQLDDALHRLSSRCTAATNSKALVVEMRKLRMRGLQFFFFLHASRRLLNVMTRRLTAQARIAGLDGGTRILKMDVSMSETDLLLYETDNFLRANELQPIELKPINELDLFLRTALLPLTSKQRERAFESARLKYAKAMRAMVSRSTKKIYKAQAFGLAVVLWRIIQPTILPLIVGFLAVYLIHAVLELVGIQFLHLSAFVLFAIVAAYVSEKIFEHGFEHWHLSLYRKNCERTGLSLYSARSVRVCL
jgi:hypothetical protein